MAKKIEDNKVDGTKKGVATPFAISTEDPRVLSVETAISDVIVKHFQNLGSNQEALIIIYMATKRHLLRQIKNLGDNHIVIEEERIKPLKETVKP